MKPEKFQLLPLGDKEQEYQAKKDELKVVSEVAPHGAHIAVFTSVGISDQWGRNIIKRDGLVMPTTENYTLISDMVREYRKIIEAEKKKLEV